MTPLTKTALAVLFSAALLASSMAHADLFKDIEKEAKKAGKKIKKAGDKAVKDTKKAAKDVAEDAEDAAEKTKDAAEEATEKAKEVAEQEAAKAAAAAKDLGQKTVEVAKDAEVLAIKAARTTVKVARRSGKTLEKVFSKESLDGMVRDLEGYLNDGANKLKFLEIVRRMEEAKPAAAKVARDADALQRKVRKATEDGVEAFTDITEFVKGLADDKVATAKLERLFVLAFKFKVNRELEELAGYFRDRFIDSRAEDSSEAQKTPVDVSAKPSAMKTEGADGRGEPQGAQGPQDKEARRRARGSKGGTPIVVKSLCISVGAGLVAVGGVAGGLEGRDAVCIDLSAPKGKAPDVRLVVQFSEKLGLGASTSGANVDISATVMFHVVPMVVDHASGLAFGAVLEGGVGFAAGEFELEWGFADGVLVGQPGIAAGLGVGTGLIPGATGALLGTYSYAYSIGRNGVDWGF